MRLMGEKPGHAARPARKNGRRCGMQALDVRNFQRMLRRLPRPAPPARVVALACPALFEAVGFAPAASFLLLHGRRLPLTVRPG
jgi:hypothetical protein